MWWVEWSEWREAFYEVASVLWFQVCSLFAKTINIRLMFSEFWFIYKFVILCVWNVKCLYKFGFFSFSFRSNRNKSRNVFNFHTTQLRTQWDWNQRKLFLCCGILINFLSLLCVVVQTNSRLCSYDSSFNLNFVVERINPSFSTFLCGILSEIKIYSKFTLKFFRRLSWAMINNFNSHEFWERKLSIPKIHHYCCRLLVL